MANKSIQAQVGLPIGGRKGAYVARNRSALIRATQEVLAEQGSEATIEDIAAQAQISVSTIYKHFENREDLCAAALEAAMHDWEQWALTVSGQSSDPLAQLIIPMRLMMRLKDSHPFYANLVSKNLTQAARYIPLLSIGLSAHIKALMKNGILEMDNPEVRIRNLQGVLFGALSNQLLNPQAKDADGDTAIEIALGMLMISPVKAKKLAHEKLPAIA